VHDSTVRLAMPGPAQCKQGAKLMPKRFMWLVAALLAPPCHASEELITTAHKKDGETIP